VHRDPPRSGWILSCVRIGGLKKPKHLRQAACEAIILAAGLDVRLPAGCQVQPEVRAAQHRLRRRDPGAYFVPDLSKVVFRTGLTSAPSLTDDVAAVIPFDSVLEDPVSGWESGSSQWPCPVGYSGFTTPLRLDHQ
jgi:hypothetical protein